MSRTCYADTLVTVPLIIPAGQAATPVVNCAVLPGFRGAGNLMRIAVPAGFPACNMTFLVQDTDTGSDIQYPHYLTDANTVTALVTIPFSGGLQSIQVPPYAFSSLRYLSAQIDTPVTPDTTINFYFQPIFEGLNNV